mmetsp:Transcript_1026/g.2201  ORF Transcript_1026/g.2201 Transcript_1026/m.2201 type:complete len:377 (-) Transcript_1026:59-1189(-)|eukprot:CAMPEP_0194327250 /NCGR_PEP_ID=MMETSP0171-20130528/40262_1 /TAXON_ID=218684 /ORGANISM="Corethron pennatum, Strain L29A3" /LENGTH=376 /DNA_ID=CAMNT_0039087135 /DNA_START=131 /DNA_END=1261 /DNA_ORIENTATION=+
MDADELRHEGIDTDFAASETLSTPIPSQDLTVTEPLESSAGDGNDTSARAALKLLDEVKVPNDGEWRRIFEETAEEMMRAIGGSFGISSFSENFAYRLEAVTKGEGYDMRGSANGTKNNPPDDERRLLTEWKEKCALSQMSLVQTKHVAIMLRKEVSTLKKISSNTLSTLESELNEKELEEIRLKAVLEEKAAKYASSEISLQIATNEIHSLRHQLSEQRSAANILGAEYDVHTSRLLGCCEELRNALKLKDGEIPEENIREDEEASANIRRNFITSKFRKGCTHAKFHRIECDPARPLSASSRLNERMRRTLYCMQVENRALHESMKKIRDEMAWHNKTMEAKNSSCNPSAGCYPENLALPILCSLDDNCAQYAL